MEDIERIDLEERIIDLEEEIERIEIHHDRNLLLITEHINAEAQLRYIF